MSFSTFSGPIRSGTVRIGSSENCGLAVLMQSKALPAAAGATTVAILPAGAQILDIIVDTTTVFDQATTLKIGDAGNDDLFVTQTTITTAGTATTGAARVTIMYAQKLADGSEDPATP